MLAGLAQTVNGVYGSRMTGGGFGGCTITLLEEWAVDKASQMLIDGYRIGMGRDVDLYVCTPSDGARLIPV
jgi:galactokinase